MYIEHLDQCMVSEKKPVSDILQTEKVVQKIRPVSGKLKCIPANNKERQVAKYQGVCHIEGLHFEKKLALTFDDGPSGITETLLDLLKEVGVKATFFWLGKNLIEFNALARRVRAEGHTFGNHSFDHTDFTKICTDEVICEQIRKSQLIYRDILGIEPSLLRPPRGEVTDDQIEALNSIGMKIVYWSIDSGDFITQNNSATRIANRVVSLLHEEAIILMHDGGSVHSSIIHAVKSIIDSCRMRGYEFVTVHDLIGAEESLY